MSVPIYTAEEMQSILSVYENIVGDQAKFETLIACHGFGDVREKVADIGSKIDAAFERSPNRDILVDSYDIAFIPNVLEAIGDIFNITDEGIIQVVEKLLADEVEAG